MYRSLVNAPGTIFDPGTCAASCWTVLALAAHTSTSPLRSASIFRAGAGSHKLSGSQRAAEELVG